MSKAGKIASLFGAGSTINPALVVVPAAVPPGTMTPFTGAAAPSGWLLCFGQAVSRTTYADLFAAIGTTYGAGDGSTTFALPDMRGRVPGGRIRSGAPEPAAHTGGELHHQDLTPMGRDARITEWLNRHRQPRA